MISLMKFGRPVTILRTLAAQKPHAAAERFLPAFTRVMKSAFTVARDAVSRDELVTACQSRDADRITAVLWPCLSVLRRAMLPYAKALEASGQTALDKLPKHRAAKRADIPKGTPPIIMRFDATNPRAIRWAAERSAEFVTNITDAQRETIRTIVARAIAEGTPPRDAAKLIRAAVGLNSPQADAVTNLYGRLIVAEPGSSVVAGSKTIRIPADGLSDEARDRAIDAYAERLLTARAATIAHDEIIAASVAGTQEGWDQAVDDGLLSAEQEQEWIATPDKNVCVICESLDGQRVKLGENFVDDESNQYPGPPAHTLCRCDIGLSA